MKNRAAIYQREAAEMLHNISLYPGLTENQLCRFFPEKEATAKVLLAHMLKEGRVFCDRNGGYYANQEAQNGADKDLSRCVWVLLDFIDQVEYHTVGEFPAAILCFANKEKQNTDLILSESETVRTKVRDNIELDLLCRNQPESAPVMQEIYELVVETIQLRSPVLRLGNNLFPMALVRERLLQLTSEHIRFVLDGLRNLHTDVKNLKKYLLTMLFNAPVTLNGRTMLDVRKSVGGGSRPMLA